MANFLFESFQLSLSRKVHNCLHFPFEELNFFSILIFHNNKEYCLNDEKRLLLTLQKKTSCGIRTHFIFNTGIFRYWIFAILGLRWLHRKEKFGENKDT
jgi:hypothetical protein